MSILPRPALDQFSPVLLESESLAVSDEQKRYIQELLKICCSDSQFARKCYNGLIYILTNGVSDVAAIESLTPSTVELGQPDFDLHVIGSGFTPTSKIFFNGSEEPTTYVSPTELTTGVNMATALSPAVVPVHVVDGEILSNSMNFEFTSAALSATSILGKKLGPKVDNTLPTPPKAEPKKLG